MLALSPAQALSTDFGFSYLRHMEKKRGEKNQTSHKSPPPFFFFFPPPANTFHMLITYKTLPGLHCPNLPLLPAARVRARPPPHPSHPPPGKKKKQKTNKTPDTEQGRAGEAGGTPGTTRHARLGERGGMRRGCGQRPDPWEGMDGERWAASCPRLGARSWQ